MATKERTLAVVLRSVDYGESDRILTLWTAAFGKISCLAKGARASRRRYHAASLQLATVSEVSVRFGKEQLHYLEEAVVKRPFPRIMASLPKIQAVSRGLHALREATAWQLPEPGLFAAVEKMFENVEAHDQLVSELVCSFQMHLLSVLGLAPRMDRCGHCGQLAPTNRAAFFDPSQGSVVCQACGGGPLFLSSHTKAQLCRAYGVDWHQLDKPWQPAELQEYERIIEACFVHRLHKRVLQPTL